MWYLYLDESGDLGFDFERKKPSEFFTITILATNHRETIKTIDLAVRKTLRRKVNKKKKSESELKGTRTSLAVKRYFFQQIAALDFELFSVTIAKRRVYRRLCRARRSKSRLYNFIAKQVLDKIPFESASGSVELVVDRSKGKREVAEFNNYVVAQLEGRLDPKYKLTINHRNSKTDRGLSAVDLFCWGIARRYECADDEWYTIFQDKIRLDKRYL